jgi:hypothetical protein
MVNYQNGKIYKITTEFTDKIYVGSTALYYLSSRLVEHKRHYNKWKKNKDTYVTVFEILKYNDAQIYLIESYPCNSKDELHSREQYWIEQNGEICVNKTNAFGFNVEKYKQYQKKYHQTEKYKAYVNNWRNNNRKLISKIHKQQITCLYCDEQLGKYRYNKHKKTIKHTANKKYFDNFFKKLNNNV